MNFLSYDVQTQDGDVIEVALSGNAANVFLLDEVNFGNYRSGRQFRYHGGYFDRSPVILKAPSSGRWHVVVDLGGRAGRVNATVRVFQQIA